MNKKFLIALLIGGMTADIYADISGVVYKELPVNGSTKNTYGIKDSNEPGVGGVTVKAYDNSGNLVDTTTTGSDGSYTLNTSSGRYRVEFSNWPNYLKPAPVGSSSHTSVQFVDDGSTNVDFGLMNPSEYIDSANPKTVTVIHINGSGNGDYNDTNSSASSANFTAITSWDYNEDDNDSFQHPIASMYQTGALWGVAYSQQRDKLYSAAVVRRHSGFGKNGTIGSIYVTTGIRNGNPTTTKFLDLNDLGIDIGNINRTYTDPSDKAHYLADDTYKHSYDLDAYRKVGKVGIGDIDLSEDEKTLYVMNLYKKEVVAIDVNSRTLKTTYPINDPGCSDGDYRPWAISTHNNGLYVGVVCSAESSQNANNLKAYVLKFNGAGFNTVLKFDLNFARQEAYYDKNATWHPWIADSDNQWHGDVYAQPILSDIEFDETGAMILGFIDRYGFMTGNNNYRIDTSRTDTEEGHAGGDILRACPNSNGTWDIENNATCAGIRTEGAGTYAGPGGGEYYIDDASGENSQGYLHHLETVVGGLAIIQGKKEVMASVYDPIKLDSGGVARLNNITGKVNHHKKELYGTKNEDGPGPHFGKSGGIGDIEFISTAAPIEIGNRVWYDENGNGIQDANEGGISGVKVKLICNNQELAEATTNSSGEFLFSNDPTKTNTPSYIYNITQLNSNSNNCKIVIPNYKNQTVLSGYIVTTRDANSNQNDNVDNDGYVNGNDVILDFNPTIVNNHTYDFGFKLNSSIDIEKSTNNQDADTEQEAVEVHYGDSITWSYVVRNNGNEPVKNIVVVDDKEGNVSCPKSSLDVNESMTCSSKHGIATKANYENNASVRAEGNVTGEVVRDSDLSHYKIVYNLCLGDFVWYDTNHNGIQDSNESGIDGIKAYLLKDGNDTGVFTITSNGGRYQFCNLQPGRYSVKFDIPSDYIVTSKNATNDDRDSDLNSDTNVTDEITLSNDNNYSLDAGLYKSNSINNGGNDNKVCIGDYVWYDSNLNGIQDSGEKGIRDVPVYLLDSNGNKLQETRTDKDGYYGFCNVEKNTTYKIKFIIPKGYVITDKNKGGNDKKDSDANKYAVITAYIGDTDNLDLDLGLYCECEDGAEHKSSGGSALNIFGLLLFILLTLKSSFVKRDN